MSMHPVPPFVVAVLTCVVLPAQNSHRKIRAKPSAIAAKAGSAVRWRASLDAARAESAKTGKPLFWYVPTLTRSPMDRKPEIDRYMMAGPFSWPRLIELLNESFVPVRARAGGDLARELGLVRNKFIEPGYVVLDKLGKELQRLDQITTFHPDWFMAPLAKLAKRDLPKRGERSATEKAFFKGVELFHAGKSKQAIELWAKLGADNPDDPIGWKAAAEAEGHGPFRYGFEVFGDLPDGVIGGASIGSRAPDGIYDETALRARSLDYLLRMQLANGGWEDSKYDFGGTDSMPNVYTACTAIIALALLEEMNEKQPVGDVARIEKALERAMAYISDDANLNPRDTDELVFAHVYRVYFFSRVVELQGGNRQADLTAVREQLAKIVEQIFAMQPGSGCWFHEYQNPFVTGEVLIALNAAEKAGAELDDGKIARGLQALLRCRAESGAFSYGFGRRPNSRVHGAAGRMPLCELALLQFGKSSQAKLGASLDVAFAHHDLMGAVRKYDDHASRYGYGGFFFWFDMLGRTRAILALKDGAARTTLREKQRDLIVNKLPEFDGCFVDSHELGRTYGTAMALLCLAQLRR